MERRIRFNDDGCLRFNSKSSNAYPLLINTSGFYEATSPFETHNSIGRDDYYLMYVIDGQLSVYINGSEHIAKKGNAVIFPPKYAYKYSGNPPAHYLYAHFTGSYADGFLTECGFDNLPRIINNEYNAEMQNKFNKLIDTFIFSEPLSILRCATILQEIILDIVQTESDKSNNSPLEASLKHIHTCFANKIDIPYLAEMERLSNSRYIAVFKKLMGKSPNEYIIDLRLQLAKSLLVNTNMSIRQISERIGYTDQYFFSRLFKKHLGLSPQEYRKENLL